MLQIAAPEAIVRLQYTPLADKRIEIERTYFINQYHKSIDEFLNHNQNDNETGLLMQVFLAIIMR